MKNLVDKVKNGARTFGAVAAIGLATLAYSPKAETTIVNGFADLVGTKGTPQYVNSREIKVAYEKIIELKKEYKGKIHVLQNEVLWCLYPSDYLKKDLNLGSGRIGGCTAGFSGISVLSDGDVYACRRLPISIGNIREGIVKLVTEKPLMKKLRQRQKENDCENSKICGGCRAVAYAVTGDYLARDPTCFKDLK